MCFLNCRVGRRRQLNMDDDKPFAGSEAATSQFRLALGKSLRIRWSTGSIPTAPTISFLMDGHLTKTHGGKKGQISPMIRFLRFFPSAWVTTGHPDFNHLNEDFQEPRLWKLMSAVRLTIQVKPRWVSRAVRLLVESQSGSGSRTPGNGSDQGRLSG